MRPIPSILLIAPLLLAAGLLAIGAPASRAATLPTRPGVTAGSLAAPTTPKQVLKRELEALAQDPKGGLFFLAEGKSLHPGGHDRQVPTLRAALRYLDYLGPADAAAAAKADAALYDPAAVAAVKRFQADVGLKDDGIVGNTTRRALRAWDADRVLMLQQSLAQPNVTAKGRYILVNVAAGLVFAVENGKVVLASRAVVGKASNQTPVFSARIVSVTLNPVWVTPDSISEKEFGGDTHIEKPGPQNPLGKYRLDMPNGYEVFLHSTNQPKLFDRDVRTFSHGCVRVEQIQAFAKWLVGDARWAAIGADAVVAGLKTEKVPLDQSVPIFLQYRTATVADTGAVIYHADPYQMAAPPPPPPVPPGYIGPPAAGPAPANPPVAQAKPTVATVATATPAAAPAPGHAAGIDVLAP